MEIFEINPFVRYANIHKMLYSREYYSICYDCRIFYFQNGKGVVTINDEIYTIVNDTIIYLPFGTRYKFNMTTEPDDVEVIVIDFDMLNIYSTKSRSIGTATEFNFNEKELAITELPDEFSKIIIKRTPKLEQLLVDCVTEFINEKLMYKEVSSSLIRQTLILLLRDEKYNQSSPLINDIIEYISNNYSKSTLSNSEIADEFGYHQYYLSNIMKSATGYTLKTYIIRYRIQMAKTLLLTTKQDINTIAWKCGFNSVPLFIKTFKEHTGSTPKKYRNKSFDIDL